MIKSTILIAADIVPTISNFELFKQGDINTLVGGGIKELLNQADFIAMNLETPLCNTLSPIQKAGPCLYAPVETVNGIKNINPYFFTLANNHVLDQGYQGLKKTIEVLKQNRIDYAGAGENINSAKQPYIAQIEGWKVGFYCCAEHEFSIATEISPGVNPYDPLESFDSVAELKKKCDYLVVLYHGGKEEYRYPSPLLQKTFRKFADSGANLVVAQHTHCIGCEEKYNGCTLVYGQGNFLFNRSVSELWKTSLIIKVEKSDKKVDISYIPIVASGNTVRMAEGEEKNSIVTGFERRSQEILGDGFVQEEYNRYAQSMEKEYLLRLHGNKSKSLITKALNKISNYRYIRSKYSVQSKIDIENVLECEAHRELAAQCMKIRSEK